VATGLTKSVIRAVYSIIFYQLMIIVGVMLILFLLKGIRSGLSALVGGLAYWLPTFIFARSLAACAGARAVTRFMVVFFGGEVFKLVLSGVLFICAVSYLPIQIVYSVIGLVVAIAAFWAASIVCLYRSEVKI
jgi:F0F1-type ATP synthase assembly protein I